MAQEACAGGGVKAAPLRPLEFIPGCNTSSDVTQSQLLENIEREVPWLEMKEPNNKALSIVAGGASLKSFWHTIAGDVMALNNAYGFLLNNGIQPDYFMLLDARPDNISFLNNICSKTHHLIAAQCHSSIFERLDGHKTTLYLTTLPNVDELTKHKDKPKVKIAGTVGTVGIKALCMAYALGYRELHLYGYDSSYEGNLHHAFPQPLNDDVKTLEVYLNGKRYITTPTLAHQATEFCAMARGMVEHYGMSIHIHGYGLLPDMVNYSNAIGEIPLEIREREKYEKIWQHDVYRKTAPGESMVEDAIANLGGGKTVIDFGCGTGRASAKFIKLGYDVISVDHAENCVDPGLELNFVQACLWDLPPISAYMGYCTDVMEHIPTEKVNDVLRGISQRTQVAYFNIATRDDSLGSLIGQKLHMTVMPAKYWKSLMEQYWDDIEMRESEGECIFIVKKSSAS